MSIHGRRVRVRLDYGDVERFAVGVQLQKLVHHFAQFGVFEYDRMRCSAGARHGDIEQPILLMLFAFAEQLAVAQMETVVELPCRRDLSI